MFDDWPKLQGVFLGSEWDVGYAGEMSRKPYPSDLTDAQWNELAPLLPPDTTRGHPRTTDLREVVNGILYVSRGGIPRHLMPHDLPLWGTVWWYFRKWRDDGTWERVAEALRARVREAAGREAIPSVAIIGSQTVKTTEKVASGPRRWQTGNRTQAAHHGGHHGIAAGGAGPCRQHSGSGRRKAGVGQTVGSVPCGCSTIGQ